MNFNDYVESVKNWTYNYPLPHRIGDKIYIPSGIGKNLVWIESEI